MGYDISPETLDSSSGGLRGRQLRHGDGLPPGRRTRRRASGDRPYRSTCPAPVVPNGRRLRGRSGDLCQHLAQLPRQSDCRASPTAERSPGAVSSASGLLRTRPYPLTLRLSEKTFSRPLTLLRGSRALGAGDDRGAGWHGRRRHPPGTTGPGSPGANRRPQVGRGNRSASSRGRTRGGGTVFVRRSRRLRSRA